MARPGTIDLGVFAQGSLPYPIVHTYLQSDGTTAIDITGWTVTIKAEGPTGSSPGGGTPSVNDGTNGKAGYVFAAADMATVGDYTLLIWVTDGTQKLHSDLYQWTVYDGPGTAGPT